MGTLALTIEAKLDAPPISLPRQMLQLLVTGAKYTSGTQTIAFAAHEAIAVGSDHTNLGICVFINLDATHFVTIGVQDGATFEPTAKLLPGDIAVFRAASNSLFAKADTAAVELQKLMFEP
jgi:hypothetical protein